MSDLALAISLTSDLLTINLLEGILAKFAQKISCKRTKYLKAGDVMELGIGGLGVSRQEAVAYQPNV